ncbi:MAG: hypothetical protein M5U34_31235 [Chloroflexi bacterium]|nr:hypothetical protein [Chloroflexota bacterium]
MNDQKLKIEDWTNPSDDQSSIFNPQSLIDQRLVSYSLSISHISALDFLHHAQGQERFFWEDVRDHITFAGFGAAANLMAWGNGRYQSIQQQASALFTDAILLNDVPDLAKPRLFGGFAFRDDFLPDNTWAAFHPAHFIAPLPIRADRGEAWLTINALIPLSDEPEHSLPILREALETRQDVLKEMGEWRLKSGDSSILNLHSLTYQCLKPSGRASSIKPATTLPHGIKEGGVGASV